MNDEVVASIAGYFADRVRDVSQPNAFAPRRSKETYVMQRKEERQHDSRSEAACNSSRRTRTTSYMRYKLPAAKRKSKSALPTSIKNCRQKRRSKSILRNLHNIHTITDSDLNSSTTPGHDRWLETHFWHRKRFVMATQWGYCLPSYHCNRGFKFLHAAMRNATVIHDSSYLRPIQLTGKPPTIPHSPSIFTHHSYQS